MTVAMTPLGLMAAAPLENRFRFGFALRNRKQSVYSRRHGGVRERIS